MGFLRFSPEYGDPLARLQFHGRHHEPVSSGEVASGISAKIGTLPEGFTHQTLLVIDHSVNRAFDTWGRMLTGINGK